MELIQSLTVFGSIWQRNVHDLGPLLLAWAGVLLGVSAPLGPARSRGARTVGTAVGVGGRGTVDAGNLRSKLHKKRVSSHSRFFSSCDS